MQLLLLIPHRKILDDRTCHMRVQVVDRRAETTADTLAVYTATKRTLFRSRALSCKLGKKGTCSSHSEPFVAVNIRWHRRNDAA